VAKTRATKTKKTAKKTSRSSGGGGAKAKPKSLMAQFAEAFEGVNQDLIDQATKNTNASAARDRWDPPDGDYILEITPDSSMWTYEPEDDDPCPVLNLSLEIKHGPKPEEIGLVKQRSYFFRPRESRDGGHWIPEAGEIKAMAALLFEKDEVPESLQDLCVAVASQAGVKFDVGVSSRTWDKDDGTTGRQAQFEWRGVIDE